MELRVQIPPPALLESYGYFRFAGVFMGLPLFAWRGLSQ
jgi:hypothetical protein